MSAGWTETRRSWRRCVAARWTAGSVAACSSRGRGAAAELDRSYAAADVMVLASRAETYGMVVIEALARGLPVIAADVGGLTEALGHGADGIRPGLLVAPGDAAALATALRAWLGDAELRRRLRRAALERRESLPDWSTHRVCARVGPGGGVTMSDEVVRVSDDWLALREPCRCRRPFARARRTPRTPGSRPLGDPRPRGRHRRDGPLARAAVARAAALDRARPRRGRCSRSQRRDPPGPAADGAAVTVETRQSDITRLRAG